MPPCLNTYRKPVVLYRIVIFHTLVLRVLRRYVLCELRRYHLGVLRRHVLDYKFNGFH